MMNGFTSSAASLFRHRFSAYIYIIMCICFLSACNSDEKKGTTAKGKAQSAPYELLVVADKDWLNTDAGQRLIATVEAPIAGLPQAEPNFRVTYINPYAFSGTFKGYSNIVVAEVGKKHPKASVAMQKNVYAQPQVVLYIYAPDNQSFVSCLEKNQAAILTRLNENEFARERNFLKKHHSGVVLEEAKKLFGIEIYAPAEIDDIKKGKDFFWASSRKKEFRQNVCIYSLPMQELTTERLVAIRDSVMKVNIPGGHEGQWMETDARTVSESMVKVDGKDIFSLRGLWYMRNDAMGGPFVCYVYPDEKNNRLLVAEGFVFSPEEKKRALVRGLEAALQTFTFSAVAQ